MKDIENKRCQLTKEDDFEIIMESYYKLLDEHADWSNSGGDLANQLAKDALIFFYDDYENRLPDTSYSAYQRSSCYFSFLDDICFIRSVLRKRRYREACWEISSFIQRQEIFHKRIYNSLKYLLKTELMETDDEYNVIFQER